MNASYADGRRLWSKGAGGGASCSQQAGDEQRAIHC